MSTQYATGARSFVKMHGLGNDFVIMDARQQALPLSLTQIRMLSHRRFGIGCDQFVVMEPPSGQYPEADIFMRLYNGADGGEVSACGNATRCVGALLFAEAPRGQVKIETRAGLLTAYSAENGAVTVDMGAPRLDWRDIPLKEEMDTLSLPIREGALMNPCAVSMGNPHMVFFAANADKADLGALGPVLERHPLYPEGANVSVAEVIGRDHIKLRVWERAAGQTLACGTAACAALVAAARRNLTGRAAQVDLPGGSLAIEWRADDDHVLMTGPVSVAFMGMTELPGNGGGAELSEAAMQMAEAGMA